MAKLIKIRLHKLGNSYNFNIPTKDACLLVIDCAKGMLFNGHEEKMNMLLDKMREFDIRIYRANHGFELALNVDKSDIILEKSDDFKQFPKFIFYIGYSIDKCMIGRRLGIPFAWYANKTAILIKDLTATAAYHDIDYDSLFNVTVRVIEYNFAYTTTFQDIIYSLNQIKNVII